MIDLQWRELWNKLQVICPGQGLGNLPHHQMVPEITPLAPEAISANNAGQKPSHFKMFLGFCNSAYRYGRHSGQTAIHNSC